VHCHDDFGCATANSLMGVMAGARQVEGTLYQLGERAGNAAWEEVVMAVRKRQNVFACDTRIDTTLFWEASRLIERITKVSIPRNKAVVGENAFSHESGIHQDGVLKNPETYEVMRPEEVGWQGISLPLGPQSGRHALAERLKKLNIGLNSNAFAEMFTRFKTYADEHGQVSNETLYSLADNLRDSNIA
jgi:2-isopropylmalate synthase